MSCATATVHVRSGRNQPLLLLPAIMEVQTLLFFMTTFTCPALKEPPLPRSLCLCLDREAPAQCWSISQGAVAGGRLGADSYLVQAQGTCFPAALSACWIEFSGTEGMAGWVQLWVRHSSGSGTATANPRSAHRPSPAPTATLRAEQNLCRKND